MAIGQARRALPAASAGHHGPPSDFPTSGIRFRLALLGFVEHYHLIIE
jgi:hypothetical protein